jgi:hypothetical protein
LPRGTVVARSEAECENVAKGGIGLYSRGTQHFSSILQVINKQIVHGLLNHETYSQAISIPPNIIIVVELINQLINLIQIQFRFVPQVADVKALLHCYPMSSLWDCFTKDRHIDRNN